MYLYKISFSSGLTDKVYVGITIRPIAVRLKEHIRCRSRKSLITKAIKKYGEENAIIETLAECDDWELLCLAEQEAIDKLNCKVPYGYNLSDGGEGPNGWTPTEETRIKMANGQMGRKHSEETKRKRSESVKKSITPEYLAALRIRSSSLRHSEETKKKLSELHKGRQVSEETRRKISLAGKGRKRDPDTIRKTSEWHRGKKRSDETRKKMSDNRKDKRPVKCVESGAVFESIECAAEWLRNNGWSKATRTGVWLCLNGKHKKSYGYKWEYLRAS